MHVDAVASLLMGHEPELLPYLVVAGERGLGETNPARISSYRLPDLEPLSVGQLREMVVPLPVLLHRDGKVKTQFTREALKGPGFRVQAGAASCV